MNTLELLIHLLTFTLAVSFSDFMDRILDKFHFKASVMLNFLYILILGGLIVYLHTVRNERRRRDGSETKVKDENLRDNGEVLTVNALETHHNHSR